MGYGIEIWRSIAAGWLGIWSCHTSLATSRDLRGILRKLQYMFVISPLQNDLFRPESTVARGRRTSISWSLSCTHGVRVELSKRTCHALDLWLTRTCSTQVQIDGLSPNTNPSLTHQPIPHSHSIRPDTQLMTWHLVKFALHILPCIHIPLRQAPIRLL